MLHQKQQLMQYHTQHQHHVNTEHHAQHHAPEGTTEDHFKLAISATLHCLLGCGLGEVLGMIIGNSLEWSMWNTTFLAIVLGFVFGFALGVIPLLRKGFSFIQAFRIVFIAEGLSILVMEFFEVGTQWVIPGVMEAGLSSSIFWLGMLASLVVGFLAALPVNYYMIRRGVRHQH